MTHSMRHAARRLAAPSRGAEALVLKFVENGRPFDVAVEPQLTTSDLRLMLRLALAGAGITFAPDDSLRSHSDEITQNRATVLCKPMCDHRHEGTTTPPIPAEFDCVVE